MELLIVLITYNRLDYTRMTLENLINTIDVPYYLVVVDNASEDDTQDWLKKNADRKRIDKLIFNPTNLYPGKACNMGWQAGLPDYPQANFLMRLDNDMNFVPHWASRAKQYFDNIPPLGQLGLDNTALDTFNGDERYLTKMGNRTINAWPGNVGGPCIIRQDAYEKGARYDETPWQDLKLKMVTPQEDVKFSLSMHNYGYIYGHPTEKLAWTFANKDNWKDYPEYYEKTFKERGYEWS